MGDRKRRVMAGLAQKNFGHRDFREGRRLSAPRRGEAVGHACRL